MWDYETCPIHDYQYVGACCPECAKRDLDCAFHQDGVVDAPCACHGTPESFAPVEIVMGEVYEVRVDDPRTVEE